MNINEVQRSNGVTRRNLVVEWCASRDTALFKREMKTKIVHISPSKLCGRMDECTCPLLEPETIIPLGIMVSARTMYECCKLDHCVFHLSFYMTVSQDIGIQMRWGKIKV